MHAMQTTIATTLRNTPGAIAFAQDMLLNVPLIADWQAIARTREHHVNENLQRANWTQRQFDYAAGQQVVKKVHDPTKFGVRMEGPYIIECIHINGNLTILLHDQITECISIRRVLLGAVLIKNHASLIKWKKFHVLFLKIATYQRSPRIVYVLKGTKEEPKVTKEEPKREPKPPSLAIVFQ